MLTAEALAHNQRTPMKLTEAILAALLLAASLPALAMEPARICKCQTW